MAYMLSEIGVKMIEALAQIVIAVLIALGLSYLVMLGCMRKGRPDKVKNHRFNYWVMRCEICGLELYGSTQVSLNKSFMWHVTNKHGDAQ
jgi:hypothetical protein